MNPFVDKARPKLDAILANNADGPTRVVAEAIVKGANSVRSCALNGGLASNELRQIAWPFLLSSRMTPEHSFGPERDAKTESETYRQIELDVPRSVALEHREKMLKFLKDFFRINRDLSFYQGFADVAYAIYRVMVDGVNEAGESAAHFVLGRLSQEFFIREAHRPNFDAVYAYLKSLNQIIAHTDKDLAKLWEDVEGDHYWAISPLVCLFCHDLDLGAAAKLLDAIIASDTCYEFPVYLVAALLTLPRVKTMLLDGDREASALHETMLKACRDASLVDDLIQGAIVLQERMPSKFVFKTAISAGLPSDSILFASQTTTSSGGSLTSKKRSWRTLNFISHALEIF